MTTLHQSDKIDKEVHLTWLPEISSVIYHKIKIELIGMEPSYVSGLETVTFSSVIVHQTIYEHDY